MSTLIAVAGPIAAACAAAVAIVNVRRAGTAARLGVPTSSREWPSLTLSRRDTIVAVAILAAGWLVGRVVGAALGLAVAIVIHRIRFGRSRAVSPIVVLERFADAIGALAAAVRSGASLPQAIRYAAGEASPPIRDELLRVIEDLDTGVALDPALAAWAKRQPTSDTDLVVGALELHRRSGGDLPAVLDQVTATIRERVSIAREVRSLTAQARLSAWILGLLPVGFFAFLWLTSRRDIEGALSTPVGIVCVGLGLALEGGAFLWIRSLLEVE